MTDKEIVERAKKAEKRTGFGELVHSPISKGINSAFGIGFIEGMVEYRNSLQEEPVVPKVLEDMLNAKTAAESLGISAEEHDKIIDLCLYGEKPVSEELEKALANEWKGYIDRGAATVDALEDNTQELTFAKGFYRGAKWQKEKEYTCYEEAFEDGASWKKEEMMANAIETTVYIDAGNYPYIPQIELYDYDKDIPLAKEGDKYKVILIKE